MTKKEAMVFLALGTRMTHRYFSREEWVRLDNDRYEFEDGVRCTYQEYWSHRTEDWWDSGWEVYSDD